VILVQNVNRSTSTGKNTLPLNRTIQAVVCSGLVVGLTFSPSHNFKGASVAINLHIYLFTALILACQQLTEPWDNAPPPRCLLWLQLKMGTIATLPWLVTTAFPKKRESSSSHRRRKGRRFDHETVPRPRCRTVL